MKPTIYFRVDADQGVNLGLGHLQRTLNLYREIKKHTKRKYNFFFIVKKNQFCEKIIKKQTKERLIYYNFKNLRKLNLKKKDLMIIDTLGIDSNLSKFLFKKNFENTISFDEINLNKFRKGIIINGIFYAKKKINSSKDIKVYQGPKYLILDKKYSKSKKKTNFKNVIKILISSGGSDKKNFLLRTLKFLKNIPELRIKIAIGQGAKQNLIRKKIKSYRNVLPVIGKKNLYKYFSESNLNIVSGGTVMFESICSGKMTFVGLTYQNQKFAVRLLSNKKLINFLGPVHSLNFRILKKYLTPKKFKKLDSKKSFLNRINYIDGKGLIRVKNIILNYLNDIQRRSSRYDFI